MSAISPTSGQSPAGETQRVRELYEKEAPRYDRSMAFFERLLFRALSKLQRELHPLRKNSQDREHFLELLAGQRNGFVVA